MAFFLGDADIAWKGLIIIRKKMRSFIPYFLLALAVIGAYKAISEIGFFAGIVMRIWGIITPFFYGFLLAYVINIPCSGIQKLLAKSKIGFVVRRKKALGILIVFVLIGLLFSLVLNLIIPTIANSVALFVTDFPIYYAGAVQFVNYINSLDLFGLHISIDVIIQWFQQMLHFSMENVASSIDAIVGVSSAIFRGFLAIISSIYILAEKDKFKVFLRRMIKAFIPAAAYGVIMHHTDNLNKNFKQYLYTQTIDGFILGTLVTIELYLLGSPYFLILGIMLGIVNYIPYFGSIIGSLVAIIVVMFTQGFTTGLITAVVLLITQQIDGNFIQPRLMGGSFSLSPFLVIVSITIGGAFAGVLGMIAAIPIVAVLKDIFESIIVHYERKKSEPPKETRIAEPER